jgi:hypothetical protein
MPSSDDIADRIRRGLTGTPEHVGNYLNGSAGDDMRQLLDEWAAARARYMIARAERMAAEARLARVQRERDRLRRWVGYR